MFYGDGINTHVWDVFFRHAETSRSSSVKQTIPFTHTTLRHCRVCFYVFKGQPFPKQLSFVLWVSLYPWIIGRFIYLSFRLTSQVYMQQHNMENEAKESKDLLLDVSSVVKF